MDRITHIGHDHPMDHIKTFWSYVDYGDENRKYFYVGDVTQDEYLHAKPEQLVDGPTQVDCATYSDFGVLVRRTFLYHPMAWHKIHYRLIDRWGNEPRAFVRQEWPGGFSKGMASIRGPHQNGKYIMQVRHLGDVLDEIEFELIGCENRE